MTTTPKPFYLLRWFSVVSFVAISLITIAFGITVSRFVLSEIVQRDSRLSAELIQAMAKSEVRHAQIGSDHSMIDFLDFRTVPAGLEGRQNLRLRVRNEFLDHIRFFPNALLVHVYASDRVIIWSSNPDMIGFEMAGNEQLEKAFRSNTPVTSTYARLDGGRQEQVFLTPPTGLFIENYIPLQGLDGEPEAVVEIYWEPTDLLAGIQRAYGLLWLLVLLGAALIYLTLFWIVRRGSLLMQAQQRALAENKTWVTMGEMSYAVAHSLRNPLATIRSSAELALDADVPDARKNVTDIIQQVDRLSRWLRELLFVAHPMDGELEGIDLLPVVRNVLDGFQQQIEQTGVAVEWVQPMAARPRVLGDSALITQALNSVIANALEAMGKNGGHLRISIVSALKDKQVILAISDSGPGMSPDRLAKVMQPFSTTKSGGLGVGLALVKRVMDRSRGRFEIESHPGLGTDVRLTFQAANGE